VSPLELIGGVVLGVLAGVLSGLLGVGGGVVMVPAMVLLMGVDQQTAQGTSLLVIIPTALSGAITHYRHGLLRDRTPILIGLIGMAAAIGGSWLALHLDSTRLRQVFAIYLAFIGARSILSRPKDG
jgi:uncharacterized membrane protein YfcA